MAAPLAPVLSLSTTGFSDASQCLKKYEFHFEDHLIPLAHSLKPYMRLGIWVHRCLQDFHTGRDWGDTLVGLARWALDKGVDEDSVLDIAQKVLNIVEGYIEYWRGKDDFTAVEGFERELKHLYGAVELRSTIDHIARTPRGLFIVETKTTTQIPRASWRAVDPQTAIQVVNARAAGIPVEGVIFNYLLTTPPSIPRIKKDGTFYANTAVTTGRAFDESIKQRVAEGIGPEMVKALFDQRNQYVDDGKFYRRDYTYRNDAMLVESMRDIAAVSQQIIDAREAGYFPRSLHVRNCPMFCPYQELCVTEYVTGQRSEVMREELFTLDDGTREGALVFSTDDE